MERVMHSRFGSLSGGQKRRVLFARAIVTPPQILILDEPTANIDLNTETLIEELIETFVYKNGIAVLAVSHSRNFGKNARELILSEGTLHG
jgi:multidrug/hemolysin transport system ATP-binding protein